MPTITRSKPRTRIARATESAAKRRLVTPEDLLRLQYASDPRISPDGSAIVCVRKHVDREKNEYVTNLWMVDASARRNGQGAPRQFTSGGKDSHPRWSPGGRQIAFIGGREKTKPQIYVIPATGGEAVALTSFPEGCIAAFRYSPDGTMLAVSFREQDPQSTEQAKKERKEKGLTDPPRVVEDWWYRLDGDGYFCSQRHRLYIVDVRSGAHRELYGKDSMGHFSFDWAPDSNRLIVATNRDKRAMIRPWKDELVLIDVASGRLKRLDLPDGVKYGPEWSPDGRWIAYVGKPGTEGAYGTENLELWVCDAAGRDARSLTGRQDYCLLAVAISDASEVKFAPNYVWSPDSKRLYMQLGWHGESHVASVPVRGGKIAFHTRGQRMHGLGNISNDGRRIALTVGAATRPDELFVGRVGATLQLEQLSDFNGPLLKQLSLARLESAWATAEDGTKVQTWVMKPPSFKPGRKYPAVLEIHGGPHGMYGVGYFHEFQILAANGYVVFFSNPRGSKGYGRDFCSAIRGSWGGKDWQDIQAVIRFMQDQSFVDPRRMGVMGGSYGGYMTNWVIGHTRVFAGAITDRCVSNLVSMAGTSDYVEEPDRYWEGNAWDRPEARWDQSPMKYIGNARTPTLIIHSEGDLRCNVEQAEQVFSALKLLNVPTRFVRYPTCTSHGMSRAGPPDMRTHRLHEILNWWKKWL